MFLWFEMFTKKLLQTSYKFHFRPFGLLAKPCVGNWSMFSAPVANMRTRHFRTVALVKIILAIDHRVLNTYLYLVLIIMTNEYIARGVFRRQPW